MNYAKRKSSMIADESAARIVVRCLIVDDLEANLLSLAALLRSDDVEVITARSGVEALELLLASDVALALIDVQMPEMDGFELAELIRGSERTRHIPLIFVTAGERQERRMFEGYESGAVDFLYKPIDAQILRSKAEVFFQLDRQRQQLARELETKSENLRLNELFLGVLGHDLRNPLTTVLTSAEYLRQSDDPKIAKFGGWIHASGERMSRLIEDTLDLVRMRVGGGNLSGIWDADRVAQVASNLIGNAARHGTAGSAITIDARGSDSAVVLTVANQGSIAPELLPCIFDPFRGTRDRHRGRYGGLGLGLYIVQQVVLAHGGRIDIRTTDDTTTFIVDLPHPAAGGASGPKRRNAEI
jgi:signal transduction histidine kinase